MRSFSERLAYALPLAFLFVIVVQSIALNVQLVNKGLFGEALVYIVSEYVAIVFYLLFALMISFNENVTRRNDESEGEEKEKEEEVTYYEG